MYRKTWNIKVFTFVEIDINEKIVPLFMGSLSAIILCLFVDLQSIDRYGCMYVCMCVYYGLMAGNNISGCKIMVQ